MAKESGKIRPYSFLLVQVNRLADGIWIVAGLVFAASLTGSPWRVDVTWLGVAGALVFFLMAVATQVYRSWRISPLHEELFLVWRCWIATGLTIVFGLYLFDADANLPKALVVTWLITAPALLSITRVAIRLALRASRRAGRNFRLAAIVGANHLGIRVARRIESGRWMGLRLVGYYDDRDPGGDRISAFTPHPLGTLEDLIKRAEAGELDIVYITLPMRAEARIKTVVERLANTTISVYYIPDFSVFDLLHAQWESLEDVPILRIVDTPFNGLNAFTKRIQDISFALILLAVCALPMVAIAVAIKLETPGPAIYRQRRHGLDGVEFEIWKFRTMAASPADAPFVQVTRKDSRVTRVGQFLRRTSIDELPQLVNVLQGRMSIVGPRPHPLKLNDDHRALVYRFMLRHKVRPGITGWAQVNGLRGETDTIDKMQRRLEYDLEYIHNWSLWLDLRIMFLTVVRGFRDQNAY